MPSSTFTLLGSFTTGPLVPVSIFHLVISKLSPSNSSDQYNSHCFCGLAVVVVVGILVVVVVVGAAVVVVVVVTVVVVVVMVVSFSVVWVAVTVVSAVTAVVDVVAVVLTVADGAVDTEEAVPPSGGASDGLPQAVKGNKHKARSRHKMRLKTEPFIAYASFFLHATISVC